VLTLRSFSPKCRRLASLQAFHCEPGRLSSSTSHTSPRGSLRNEEEDRPSVDGLRTRTSSRPCIGGARAGAVRRPAPPWVATWGSCRANRSSRPANRCSRDDARGFQRGSFPLAIAERSESLPGGLPQSLYGVSASGGPAEAGAL